MTAAAKDHLGSNLEFFLLISAGDMMQNQKARAIQGHVAQVKLKATINTESVHRRAKIRDSRNHH
jgi:hypothetical protein